MKRPTTPQGSHEDFRQYSGKVSRQASVFLLGTLFSVTVGYLFKAYLGHILGAEALGLYALGLQTVGLLVLLAGLGFPAVLARYVAVYRSRQQEGRIGLLLRQSLRRSLGLSIACAGLLWFVRQPLAVGFFDAPSLAPYLPFFALLIPLSVGNSMLGQYLRGHQKVTQRTLISHFVQFPIKVGVTLALLHWGLGLAGYITAELISQLLAVILLLRFAMRLTPPTKISMHGIDAENRVYGRHMLGLETLRFFSSRIDILLLGVLMSTDRVGIYSMAVASAAFVPTLLRALVSIFGPIISDLHARGDMETLQRLFKTTTQWCLGLTCPLVMTLVAFAPALMGLFGDPFSVGSTALVWLALGQLVNVGTGAVGNLLVMSGHQRLELWVSAFTAIVTVVLCLLCIPVWGMAGAGAAVGGGLMLSNGLRLILVWRVLALRPYDLRSLRLIVPIAAAAACTWAVAQSWGSDSLLGLGIALIASYGVFCLTVWPLFSNDDRILLGEIRGRRGRRGHPTN